MTLLGPVGCSDRVPPDLRPLVDRRLPLAISLAEKAAEQCAALRDRQSAAPPSSPAAGTALAEELTVTEILVRCDWMPADTPETVPAGGDRSLAFAPLRQAEQRTHQPPPRLVYDNYLARGDWDFEHVHVPSVFSELTSSADIVVTRPIPGGGTVEVTVAMERR